LMRRGDVDALNCHTLRQFRPISLAWVLDDHSRSPRWRGPPSGIRLDRSSPRRHGEQPGGPASGREVVGVYTHCTPRLQDYQPTVFATNASEPFWLLIEDLTHLRFGDQVLGLRYEWTMPSSGMPPTPWTSRPGKPCAIAAAGPEPAVPRSQPGFRRGGRDACRSLCRSGRTQPPPQET